MFKSFDTVIVAYDELYQIIGKIKTDMENFKNQCFEKSDKCKYVLQGLKLVSLVVMLVAAYCKGNWKLHVAVMEELLSVFIEVDSIIYLRHASWYLKWVKTLKNENSYLYETFLQGHFVVKDKQKKSNSVSPNMKREQTMQTASKYPGGIIG